MFPPYFSCPRKRRYASKRRTLDSSKEIQECEEHKLLMQSSRFNLILRSLAGRRSAARVTIGEAESSVMAYESPPAETRRCESCGETLSLNFFGLDTAECRSCEQQRRPIEVEEPEAVF